MDGQLCVCVCVFFIHVHIFGYITYSLHVGVKSSLCIVLVNGFVIVKRSSIKSNVHQYAWLSERS